MRAATASRPERLLFAERVTRLHANGLGVREVTAGVDPGQVVGLVGPNGSGKTTLLRVLATVDPPTAGALTWFGCPDRRSPAVRRRIGVALDGAVHLDGLTGWQNAAFFAAQYGLNGRTAHQRLDGLFAWAGLSHARHLPVGEYSLGMRRRLSLLEAFCHRPDLLLLDEPSLALDSEGGVDLAGKLRDLAGTGTGIVLATNDDRLAGAVCDQVIRLAGRLAELP